MIGIIDYGMGNLRSVQKAFEKVGAEAVILRGPDEVQRVDRLVLPGVGAFADGMEQLRTRGYEQAIKDFVATGKPFLGVCLGLQLLFDDSEEDAPNEGLSLLKGHVIRFAGSPFGPGKLKVPHMGWNTLTIHKPGCPLLCGIEHDASVYFVHGYYAQPDDANTVVAVTDYGGPVCAIVQHNNVLATQFHPEKSQAVGLKMLANFAAFN
ncbi:MAG: imidazole glycerol phosphate synthase subunit HisH [Phycisphaera sp.]|nr:imidazole glycerol phosphate synthase subunit HisH [Phycisphaera sp.]